MRYTSLPTPEYGVIGLRPDRLAGNFLFSSDDTEGVSSQHGSIYGQDAEPMMSNSAL